MKWLQPRLVRCWRVRQVTRWWAVCNHPWPSRLKSYHASPWGSRHFNNVVKCPRPQRTWFQNWSKMQCNISYVWTHHSYLVVGLYIKGLPCLLSYTAISFHFVPLDLCDILQVRSLSTDDGAGASSSRPMGRVRCKGCDTTTSNIPDQESSVCCTGCGKIICLLCTPDINNAKPCYKPRGGIAQHQRNKHAETYHKQNIPEPVKKRWTEEDLTVLAMEELNAPPGTRFINQYLHSVIPSRSTGSISCQSKATRFENIL